MSCTGDFLPKVELRRKDAGGDFIAQPAVHSQTLALSGGRTRDNDHTIEVLLSPRLIQQRDVDANPVFPGLRTFEQRNPPLADARMEDRFEIVAGRLIAKNALPQSGPVRSSIGLENLRAKSLTDEFSDGGISRE